MLRRIALFTLVLGVPSTASAQADQIEWAVVNPFRFYRQERALEPHRAVLQAVIRDSGGQIPEDVVTRMERLLNVPDCSDRSSYEACFATAGEHWDRSGWAGPLPAPL